MAYSEELAQRMSAALIEVPDLVEKKMFGGIGFMVRGNMACGVNKDDLIVRVGPEHYQEALDHPHTKVFDMTGRPMTGWIVVLEDGYVSEDDLKDWIQQGVDFALSLQPK
jgi:TfoX/Sxy family transcriptional regulator of competence genes